MQTAITGLSLHPDHLADLRRSGLTDETIATAEIHSLAPAEFPRHLGLSFAAKVRSCYVIPYPDADGFSRMKLFPPLLDKDGHTARYYQPAGTAPHLYLPPRARAAVADPTVVLMVTEGEKKALKADQEGLACAALGGLWSWLLKGKPLPDLDRVDWCEREALLVPDSDVWTRPDLLQAVYALGKELEARGAKVTVLKLPAGENGAKVGLDDYLYQHRVTELEALPRLPLTHPVFSKTAAWWKGWQKRKTTAETPAPGALELLERGETVQHLHPAQDMVDGVLFYGVTVGKELVVITSKREGIVADQIPAGLALRHNNPGPSSVSREVAFAWCSGGAPGSVAKALDELDRFFSRYVIFRDCRTSLLLAVWILGTYCYRAFHIYPYLHFRSTERRCAKTRVLKLIAKVGFNASPVTTSPTEAQLYRGAARCGGVQIFDEMDSLKGNKERFNLFIGVLNVGFERGGVVTRLEKRGEQYIEIPYEVYAPRALAGLSGLKDTLEDRTFPIFMLRKRRDEPVARLTAAVGTEAQGLRDRCALACLTHIGNILTSYENAPTLLEREAIDDRAVDLWTPMIALVLVADAEAGGDRTLRLLALAREMANVRDSNAETGLTHRLLSALWDIREEAGEEAWTPTDLHRTLQGRFRWEWVKTTRKLAGLLNPLGLVASHQRQGERRGRFYRLDREVLADLRERYSPPGPAGDTA